MDGVGSALTQPHVPDIPGLHYIRGFLDDDQQRSAVHQIDEAAGWLTDLERRVQHYGWRYDYRARTTDRSMRIGPLPAWLEAIAVLLYERTGQFASVPNQAIVNEYEQGQGIAMHVDRQCFGPTVATVSLGDDWMMDFRAVGGRERERLLLGARFGSRTHGEGQVWLAPRHRQAQIRVRRAGSTTSGTATVPDIPDRQAHPQTSHKILFFQEPASLKRSD